MRPAKQKDKWKSEGQPHFYSLGFRPSGSANEAARQIIPAWFFDKCSIFKQLLVFAAGRFLASVFLEIENLRGCYEDK